MKLRDHPKMMKTGLSLWPPMWGGTHSESPLSEDGILIDVKNFDEPDGHVSITMEFNGKRFRGILYPDDVGFREEVYELLKRNTKKSIREAGDLDIQS